MLYSAEIVLVFDDVCRVERYSLSVEGARRAVMSARPAAPDADRQPLLVVASLVLAVSPLGATPVRREHECDDNTDGGDPNGGDHKRREHLRRRRDR